MNYKVLYRKYRPNNFENILGQDYIVKTLKNSIINNVISHAYIFSGPRGTGKTSTAKVFSKAINCSNNVDGSPCDKCEFCTNFIENPDIIEIDAASNNGVDEIRGLIDNIKLTPTNGKYKVYIIDEVHMLTTSAFNALLLTLEEPPAHAIFILATTNIENVPITILSRCQRFDFQKITVENIVEGLKNVCEKENIEIETEALTEIAYLSEGGMRDALSLLDQLSKNKQKITLDLVENQIKTISQKGINELLNAIEENNIEKCLCLINDYRVRAINYKTIVKKVIDIASIKAKKIKKSGSYNRLKFCHYKKLIEDLSDSLTKVNINVDPYTILEMIFLDVLELDSKEVILEPQQKLDTEDNEIEIKNKPKQINEDFISIRINNCFVNAQKIYLEEAKKLIDDVISSVNITGKIRSLITDSKVVAASDEYMILTCTNEHTAENANRLIDELESVLKESFSKKYRLIFISENRWQKEKNVYITNLKLNKKYEFINEKSEQEESEDPVISDIFDISKVEII
ncbi:MAG: DNA polymerase III subunit gamma/tau [Firmicutes bacterium]|nr:DNA polymerase III subunit gamma/tau [Bacillota bacterium]